MSIPRILIIAGSDSGGGAGIQADIKTVTMLGGFAMTAVTAITAQNTIGVQAVHLVPPETVVAQIDSVVADIGVDAVKVGMLGSPEIATAVAERLESIAAPIVFDPVMVATSGGALADGETIAAFGPLMRLASVVTPNIPELEALSGFSIWKETDRDQAIEAVMDGFRCKALLAKGGHMPFAQASDPIVDFLCVDLTDHSWSSPRIDTVHTHGTGCTLASAIAVGLARGLDLVEAIIVARKFVRAALLAAPGFGAGHGPMGHALGAVPFDLIHK